MTIQNLNELKKCDKCKSMTTETAFSFKQKNVGDDMKMKNLCIECHEHKEPSTIDGFLEFAKKCLEITKRKVRTIGSTEAQRINNLYRNKRIKRIRKTKGSTARKGKRRCIRKNVQTVNTSNASASKKNARK